MKKRVLMVAGVLNYGGLEVMLMNFLRNIDREKVQIDFMLNYEEVGAFDEEVRSLGSHIYIMPRLFPKNLFRYIRALNAFFKRHRGEYDIIHGNLTSVGAIYLPIAKKYGVKTRIIHAHYANLKGNHHAFLERLMLLPLRFCATDYFACSDAAGAFCYGKRMLEKPNYHRIQNGVDVARFAYNPEKRASLRAQYGLENAFVVLHVGRFEIVKNHAFLLPAFAAYLKKDPTAQLLLCGAGVLEDETKALAAKLGITDNVRFWGLTDAVADLMQLSDVFVLPSLFEGLPVAGVEAQAAGLPCLLSDAITREANISGNCTFLPITDGAQPWADALFAAKQFARYDTTNTMRAAGYDLMERCKWLESFYLAAK